MNKIGSKVSVAEILKLIDKYNITAYELAQNTDYSAVGIQKIIDRKTQKPQQSTVDAIFSYITENYSNEKKMITEFSSEVSHINKETPFYDVDFYSGFKSIFNDQTSKPSFYFYHPDFIKADFAVKNSGKSMGMVLSGNDIIGLRQIFSWEEYFPQGEIYAVVTSNDLRTVKYVRRDQDNKKLILIPKPKDEDRFLFPEFEEVPINMVIAMFQVVASMDSRKLAM